MKVGIRAPMRLRASRARGMVNMFLRLKGNISSSLHPKAKRKGRISLRVSPAL